ncbi:MAG: protein translocase subunit SecD, partial [Deltaproteobacteria bacterium]|nr:protein translocase subunit SecD [Deltaproteobacteria bacterium]
LILVYANKENREPDKLTQVEREQYLKNFSVEKTNYDSLTITFSDEKDTELVTKEFADRLYAGFMRLPDEGNSVTLKLNDASISEIRDSVVEQTLDVIRKRVEAFGLVEPDVRKTGDTDIDIQLPGVGKEEMEMVREKIGQTAQLAFRIVDNEGGSNFFETKKADLRKFRNKYPEKGRELDIQFDPGLKQWYLKAAKKSDLLAFLREIKIPDDHVVGYELIEKKEGNIVTEKFFRTYYMHEKADVTGDHLTRANVFFEQAGEPYVSLDFDAQGAKQFEEVTSKNVGKYLAIMLDEEVNSAPVIKEAISGGRARITMGGSRHPREILRDAQALVTVLTHGAYKAPVHKVHDFEVGPSLGKDTIRAGTTSLIVGTIAIFVFMVLYYSLGGLIADLGLIFNIIFLLAILISFNAALTLPGLAGIVLTIGMAVDANVLINERIREELRLGKTPRAAVDAGYNRAFWTIFDANITTALAALVLLNYTSGPIYGFAVTLLIGIACTFFTQVFMTRMFFNYILERYKPSRLSVGI